MSIQAKFNIQHQDFTLNVALDIPDKGITAIFGHSGCGKTTLLRALAGLEIADNGYCRIGDMLWQDQHIFCPPHQRSIGYIFQEPGLFQHMNVRRNLQYGRKRLAIGQQQISLDDVIELLGISHLLDRTAAQLSGGEQQRVAIARALAVNPKLLLMDEPLSALDFQRKQEILPYLESLHDELDIPIIYVSHSPDEVARLADHLVLMESGKILAAGAIGEMLTRLDLPLAHADEAEALIEATVAAHDLEYNLTYLDFPGGRFTVTHKPLPIGHRVRLRVTAKDVSLTLKQQSDTSILNIFQATIDEITPQGSAQVMIRLNVAGTAMLSRITRKSAQILDLHPGKIIYAQAKSVALLA